jgi:hypothetical protein
MKKAFILVFALFLLIGTITHCTEETIEPKLTGSGGVSSDPK